MKKLIFVAALSIIFASSTFAQAKPAAGPSAEALKSCRADSEAELKTLRQNYNEGYKTDTLSTAERAEAKTIFHELEVKSSGLKKDGAVLKDCTDLRAAIKTTQTRVDEMKKVVPNPALDACVSDLKKVSAEADKLFEEGIANKTIDDKTAASYKLRDVDLKRRAGKRGLSLEECNELLGHARHKKSIALLLADSKATPKTQK